jgi:hypothetical protein
MTLEELDRCYLRDRFNDALKKHDHVRALVIGYELGYPPVAVQDMLWGRGWRGSIERPKGLFTLIGEVLAKRVSLTIGAFVIKNRKANR